MDGEVRVGTPLAFVAGTGVLQRESTRRRCGRSVVVMTAPTPPPMGSKSKRRAWMQRELKKRIEEKEQEISTDIDLFNETWDGDDDSARQRFYYHQAVREERKQRFQRAKALLDKCLELNPTDTFSWMALARVTKETDPLNVQDVYEKAIENCPTSIHIHHAYAVYLHRIGKLDAARELFEKGYEIEPGNCYICQAWGLLEQDCGNSTKARELFQKAVTDNPNTEVCVALARLEGEEGNLEQARQRFELAINVSKSPVQESDAYRAWGMIEERYGNLENSEKILIKSFRAKPNEETIVVLAKVKMRNGDAPGALRLIRSIERPKKQWPTVAAMNVWANLEAKAGNFDEALKVIQLAISRYENDSGLYLTWGSLEEKQGRLEEASCHYKESFEIKANGPAFVAYARVEEKLGNIDSARDALEKAIEQDKKHASAYNALGLLELTAGNVKRAEEVFKRGLELVPSADLLNGAAQMDLRLGRVAEAREKLERGVRLTREDTSWVWHSLGMLELRSGHGVAAKKIFTEASKRYPQSPPLLVGLAMSMAATLPKGPEQDKDIRGLFEKAVKIDRYYPQAWQCWGVFEHRQGEHTKAAKIFKAGLSFNRNHGALWQAWAVLETFNGNIFSARSIFERGSSRCPDHVHLLQAWACMEVRARNIERARQLLRKALNIDPTSGPCYSALGLLEARHGNIEEAREVFSRGINAASKHAPLFRTYAEVESRRRNFTRARQLFEQGISADPTYAPLFHSYAELEGMLGNLSALSMLQKRIASIYEKQKENEADDVDSSRVHYILMEEPVDDFEPKTFMETSIEAEEKDRLDEAAEDARKAQITQRFRDRKTIDVDLDNLEEEDGDEDDEYYDEDEDDGVPGPEDTEDEGGDDIRDEVDDWEEGDVNFQN
mmetsp:Transcript_3815/g.11352  ORF Transcript_3815/g.11352 Transcript_3815/m.11352 type:complete len:897 (+) Transcript_3815:100-2790(+)